MSYPRKVALWRERNREIEERRKASKRRASQSGQKVRDFNPVPLKEGEESWLKRAIKAMDPRLWKSKRTIEHEAEVERRRQEREGKEKAAAQA